ncbi:sensor histidine kinase [Streptacidiphilus jiangxiensis]|uniref:histidine kinase n=1 Tax=Streptacidiphilus jiangxiensis TaxID=235985 RepID=A0A1H7X1E2_STRJI|nr:sensor histidine kinase [Streptacidiphilus jiangxiensis]SEM27047.1 Signal transduction histidine kinase [Streptacidiphilus jiangxiensis]
MSAGALVSAPVPDASGASGSPGAAGSGAAASGAAGSGAGAGAARPWYFSPWVTVPVPALLAALDALLANDLGSATEMITSMVAAAALLLRKRWPLIALLATLPGMELSNIWLAPMFAVYSVAVRYRNRWPMWIGGLLVALTQFVPWPWGDFTLAWDRTTALAAMYAVLTAAAPIALGMLVTTRRELAVRLDELTRGQERERRLLAQSVLSTERARLAREMHDVVSHQVSLISIQAGALQVRAGDPNATKETARTIRQLSVKTLEELRQMVGVLRAAGGDAKQLTPQPTLADLPRLVAESGLSCDLEADVEEPLPEPVERAAYRTVQEALTNVRKHAPGSCVTVRLTRGSGSLQVTVANTAGSPDATPLLLPSGGHGLIGLGERAQQLGGTLSATPTPDGGFTVAASFPTG